MSPGEWLNPINEAMHQSVIFLLLALTLTVAVKLLPASLTEALAALRPKRSLAPVKVVSRHEERAASRPRRAP